MTVDDFQKVLAGNERVVVYLDWDESPNFDFRTNVSIMRKCEKELDNYCKVIFVPAHIPDYRDLSTHLLGYIWSFPTVILFRNGAEAARKKERLLSYDPLKWIKETLDF